MKKMVAIVLISAFSIGLFGANINNTTDRVPAALTKNYEPRGEEIVPVMGQGNTTSGLREGAGVLVDSSQNGYGLLISETNPISINPYDHDQVTMAYRQYTDGVASGSIGMAYSEDAGVNWWTSSNINFGLNTAGRYPSILASEDFPIVFWNEYGGGGGDYEGRAYYSFDEGNYGGGYWYPVIDIHNNPSANDSWIVVPTQNEDADGNYIINAIVSDWSGERDRLHFRAATNGAWNGTELSISSAFSIVQNARDFLAEYDDAGDIINYTANGNMDINSEGTGYFVTASYWNDTLDIANHTLFTKKTSDYGETWSNWFHISDETLNNHFWDVFPDSIPDSENPGEYSSLAPGWTPFVGYDLEVYTDEAGGLHVMAPMLPSAGGFVYPGWSYENGLYHFYAADDVFAASGGEFIPQISFLGSMQLGWLSDTPDWSGNVVSMAYDLTYTDVLYASYHTVSDTVTIDGSYYSYVDIMGSYSDDNGATWTDPENMSNTQDPNLDETHPHLNRFADAGHVYMMYQMPDYLQQTVTPAAGEEPGTADYLNHVYYMNYDFDPIVSIDQASTQPGDFRLNENYPNPFNPSTVISFELPASGMVTLTVFDITGRQVETMHQGVLSAGQHDFSFSGQGLASGTYFYRLDSQGFQDVKKMLLIK